jgi:hypothetical protein
VYRSPAETRPFRCEDEYMLRIGWAFLLGAQLAAAELRPETVRAFESYIRATEQRLDARPAFLWVDEAPGRAARARAGQVLVEPQAGAALHQVSHGLVHDWVGTVFLPGATLAQTIAVIQDYDRAREKYQPDVIASRLLDRQGNEFRVYMRLLKKQVITVVLDTEHDVVYTPLTETRWRSVSRTTRINEVDNPGKRDERLLPLGGGQGFLYRLNSYWRFEQRDGGTWMECEAVSLTRDIPTGLNWLVQPIIRNLPKDSLEHTLASTRKAVAN